MGPTRVPKEERKLSSFQGKRGYYKFGKGERGNYQNEERYPPEDCRSETLGVVGAFPSN